MSDTQRTVLIWNWHHCAGYVWMVLFKIHLMIFLCRTLNGQYWYGTDTTASGMCEWFYWKYIWWCLHVAHWTDGAPRYMWMVPFKIHLTMSPCRTLNERYWYGIDTSLISENRPFLCSEYGRGLQRTKVCQEPALYARQADESLSGTCTLCTTNKCRG
jgi:hypothetical protein